jgi:hypothetical protein
MGFFYRNLILNAILLLCLSLFSCGGQEDIYPMFSIHVSGITLNQTTDTIVPGLSHFLAATVVPFNAADPGITWTSSNPSVLTVSSIGQITGVSVGTATVTVTANDGGFIATCIVTVRYPRIAVGDYAAGGYIWISNDGGTTWIQRAPALGWCTISMSSDGRYMTGTPADGTTRVYYSSDLGSTWTQSAYAFPTANWSSSSSSADGQYVYVVVYNPVSPIIQSTDWGVTWNPISTPVGSRGWGPVISSADGSRLIATESSFSGPDTWTITFDGTVWNADTHNMGISNQYSCIASSSDGQSLIVGAISDYLRISKDGGATWTTLNVSPGLRYWVSVASSADGRYLSAVENNNYAAPYGYIWISQDGGATWMQCVGAGQRSWRKIVSTSDGSCLVAGVNGGYIYTSIDGGVTWTQNTGANGGLPVVGNGLAISLGQ